MAGLINDIKNDVKRAGANKSKLTYIREGQKQRIRFLTDMDDGMQIIFHDDFMGGVVPTPCQETFNRPCPYCDREGIRTRSQYAWSVYNYETNEVQVFMFPVNNCSPIPTLMAMYETYGTLLDRDYVIGVTGKKQDKSYSVVPMDPVKFRNKKAKPYSNQAILKIIDKAFPCDEEVDDDDYEEDDEPKKRPVKKNKNPEPADDWGDDDKLPDDLESLSPQKLYNLCKERDIECKTRKSVDYYVGLLEEWREENEEEDDYDDDQDWGDEEDEEVDYSEMDAKDLYKLCKERKIDVQPHKPSKYYIRQLEEYDKAQDDWGDGESDDDDWEDDDE